MRNSRSCKTCFVSALFGKLQFFFLIWFRKFFSLVQCYAYFACTRILASSLQRTRTRKSDISITPLSSSLKPSTFVLSNVCARSSPTNRQIMMPISSTKITWNFFYCIPYEMKLLLRHTLDSCLTELCCSLGCANRILARSPLCVYSDFFYFYARRFCILCNKCKQP